jgi:flagellar hook-associated protein 1 FlgK
VPGFFFGKKGAVMSGAYLGLDIAKKGVMTSQKALNVVGHNVTNAETKGYSRQEVSLKADIALSVQGAGQVGTGVVLDEIKRIRDEFIDEQIRKQNAFQGHMDTLSENLTTLQTIFNEPSEYNLRASLDLFFQSMEDVNSQPENDSVRVTMLERARSLTSQIQVTAKQFDQNLARVNGDISLAVDKINSLAKSIGSLNLQIQKVQNADQNPNDLMDARDQLIDELSEQVNISVRTDSSGTLSVNIGDKLLVQGEKVLPLYALIDPDKNGMISVSDAQFIREPSSNPDVIKASMGAHVQNTKLALTVFQTATTHKVQSTAFMDLKFGLNEFSSLEQAGIQSGSIVINGTHIYFENDENFIDIKDRINAAGIGVNAYIERGKLVFSAVKSGTANQVTFSDGTSNFLEVINFSTERELDTQGNIVFDGHVQDAKYALDGKTYTSATNYVENVIPGIDVEFKGVGSSSIDVRNPVNGGKLMGLLEYQDKYLKDEISKLDSFAYSLVKSFNDIHYNGFGLDGISQRLFFNDFESPFENYVEKGAASQISLNPEINANVRSFAAASGVFDKDGDSVPVSSGSGDGSNALSLAALKHAKVVNYQDYNLNTRLTQLNSGNGVDFGRSQSRFTITNGQQNAVITLEKFNENSTIFDLQKQMNDALEKNGFSSRISISTTADGKLKIISSDESLTFLEGPGTTASDLHLTASSGALGNGTRIIQSSAVNAKFKLENYTLNEYISHSVSTIGTKAEEVYRLKNNSSVIGTQLQNERLSVSGVSIDEELTKMIQYQQAFNASARLVRMIDELLTTIVNIGS